MNSLVKLSRFTTKIHKRYTYFSSCRRFASEAIDVTNEPVKPKEGGYAKAFKKIEAQLNKETKPSVENLTFAALLRNSNFMDLGDPVGKIVQGKVFKVVDDDLYIDFGWKFHCVCPKTKNNSDAYFRGSRVRILVRDLELSSKFLGYEKDITLLEADAILLGLSQERNQTS